MNANGNLAPIPATMLPGTVTQAELDGQPVVLIGTVPTGYTVVLCPKGWATLQRWKLTTLRVARGVLYAAGKGRAGGFAAARFLLGSSGNCTVRHRNGNPFDIRLENIVAISFGLLRQAKIEAARGRGYTNPDVSWTDKAGNAHRHSGNPIKDPSAHQRIAETLRDPDSLRRNLKGLF
ncbi:hypothetical protein ACVI1J_004070 [Bradyrhizobium diazoefficiens]